jgi:hypothetical protein
MSAPTVYADALFAGLMPELEKLCKNAPLFGKITFAADIHDGDIGRVSVAIETSRKIASRATR